MLYIAIILFGKLFEKDSFFKEKNSENRVPIWATYRVHVLKLLSEFVNSHLGTNHVLTYRYKQSFNQINLITKLIFLKYIFFKRQYLIDIIDL